jgi:hypothetical protein
MFFLTMSLIFRTNTHSNIFFIEHFSFEQILFEHVIFEHITPHPIIPFVKMFCVLILLNDVYNF